MHFVLLFICIQHDRHCDDTFDSIFSGQSIVGRDGVIIDCRTSHDSYFPDPDDCTMFYHCSDWAGLEHKSCGTLYFHPQKNVCDWPYIVRRVRHDCPDSDPAPFDVEDLTSSEEAAEVRGVSLDTGAKAMLLKDTGKKLALEGVPFYLAVLSASKRFSSKQFKKLISCKSVRFATPEEVYSVTGCLTGAVPPFGKVFNIPVWVDRSLSKQASINFNCGLRTKSISMSYDDYFKIEQPKWHVFTEEEIELGDIPVEEKAEKVDSREAKKAERLAQRQKKTKDQGADENKKDPNDPAAHLFGERELNRSQGDPELRHTKKFTDIKIVDKELEGQEANPVTRRKGNPREVTKTIADVNPGRPTDVAGRGGRGTGRRATRKTRPPGRCRRLTGTTATCAGARARLHSIFQSSSPPIWHWKLPFFKNV